MRRSDPLPSWDEVVDRAHHHGITHLGVTSADVLHRARDELYRRRRLGLHADMAFTYRDPDRSTEPTRAVRDARSIIVAARPYRAVDEPARPPGPQGRVARYAWVDHYAPLRVGLREIAHRIRRADHRAVAFADDNAIVDREVAHRAGLGWFGKNANILLPGAGSWFVLGSVVTTAEYPPSSPVADGCGSCRRCLDGCPTGAIIAPGVVDANRCLAWLVQKPGTFPHEYREALGDRLYGCDDCQEVCPPTMRLGEHHRIELAAQLAPDTTTSTTTNTTTVAAPTRRPAADASAREPQAWVDVVDLLDASDRELIERHGRWYVGDREPRWWRRNALLVLGNTGDADDRRVRRVIAQYRSHADPILREHADWAAARLGLLHAADTAERTGAGPT